VTSITMANPFHPIMSLSISHDDILRPGLRVCSFREYPTKTASVCVIKAVWLPTHLYAHRLLTTR
jgi:hypothetical protein